MNFDNPFPILVMPVSAKLSDDAVHEIHAFLRAFLFSFEREYAEQIRRCQDEYPETSPEYFLDKGDLPF